MRKIILTNVQREQLMHLLANKKNTWQIRKKLETIRYADKGFSTQQIANMICIKISRVQEYIRIFKKSDLDGLLAQEKPGRDSLLTEAIFKELETYMLLCKRNKKKCTRLDQKNFLFNQFGITIQESWLAKRMRERSLSLIKDNAS